MADGYHDSDSDDWEEASDVFVIRSEAGDPEPERREEQDSDGDSGTLRNVAPPVVPRRRHVNGGSDEEDNAEAVGHRRAEGRPPSLSITPPSAYRLAPSPTRLNVKSRRKERSISPRQSRPPPKSEKAFVSRTVIRPPRFEGRDACIESHLSQFEIISRRNRWDEFEKADFLKCSLIGEASRILRDLPETATYDDVVFKLRQRYGSLEQIESFRIELKQRKRKPGESLSSLLKDIRRLFMQAYPGPPNYMSEITARDAFVDALNDRSLMIKVMEREPNTLDQAFKIAERLELYQRIPGDREPEGKVKNSSKVRGTVVDDATLQAVIETQKLMQKQLAVLSDAIQTRKPSPPGEGAVKAPASKLKGLCHHCRKPGHYRPDCPERIKTSTEAVEGPPPATRTVTAKHDTRLTPVVGGNVGVVEGLQEQPGKYPSMTDPSPMLEGHLAPPQDATVKPECLEYMRRFPPPPFFVDGSPPQVVTTGLRTPTPTSAQRNRRNRLRLITQPTDMDQKYLLFAQRGTPSLSNLKLARNCVQPC